MSADRGGSSATTSSPLVLDSLDMWERHRRPSRAGRGGRRSRPGASRTCPSHDRVENVVVLGMGGSGIAGDVLAAVGGTVHARAGHRGQGLRSRPTTWARARSCSPSRSRATPRRRSRPPPAAYEAGASLVVVAGGGALVSLAGEWDVPVVPRPGGIPQPRAALGAMAMPPLVLLEEIGLFPGALQWVDQAVDQLRVRRDELDRPGSRAEETGPADRPHHPAHPQLPGPGCGGRPAVEVPDQRERQDPGVLQRLSRAVPQRAGRLGSATATPPGS